MSLEPDLQHDPTLGPFLNALLCEKVLEEKDGIKTAVRILDQVNRSAVGDGDDPFSRHGCVSIPACPANPVKGRGGTWRDHGQA